MDVSALRQLRAADAYIRDRDIGAADGIVSRIERAAARLERLPRLGRRAPERDVRRLVVAGTRYILIYQLRPREIVIIALFHERQQQPTSFLRTFP